MGLTKPDIWSDFECFEYAKAQYCENFIEITAPKITRRDAHQTQKPLFPQLETSKRTFQFFSESFSSRKRSHSAEKRALISLNVLFQAETIYETQRVRFD